MLEKKSRTIKKLFKSAFFLASFLLFFNNVFASTLSLTPSVGTFNVGDNFSVNLVVGTDISVNAISAILSYSNTTLSLSSISKSGSIITLWPVGPNFSNQNGSANIEGVVLNGFTGSSGKIVTLNFKAIKEGSAYVRFSGGSVLANDGQGTNILSASNGSSFEIKKRAESQVKEPSQIATTNTIKIEEIKDPNLEAGQAQFLITPPRPAKNNSYSIQIDTEKIFSFVDGGDGLYKTQTLMPGNHTIRITAYDQNNKAMSGVTEFVVLSNFTDQETPASISKIDEKNTEMIIMSFAIIIVVLIILFVFTLFVIKHNKNKLRKRLQDSRNKIAKTFSLLEEDENEEIRIIRKLKNHKMLTDEEESDIIQFSKDLTDAKYIIDQDISKIDKK